MLIRLGFSSGRQGAGDETPRMRGLTVEFAIRPGAANPTQGIVMRRMPEPGRSLATAPGTPLPADQPTAIVVAGATDRPAGLEALCARFLSHASGCGFSPEEIGEMVQQLAEAEECTYRQAFERGD
ncbi:MAG: hypothetical protein KA354_14595 [Phycisphaerae bacterium]|nr:hypothetical protein [Phycisphaerae bacterium]